MSYQYYELNLAIAQVSFLPNNTTRQVIFMLRKYLYLCAYLMLACVAYADDEAETVATEPESGIYYQDGEDFLNLRIGPGGMHLYCLDAKRKKMPMKYQSATLAYRSIRPPVGKRGSAVLTLNGDALSSDRTLRPPYSAYTLFLTVDGRSFPAMQYTAN